LTFTAVEELTHNRQTKTRKKSKMPTKKTKKNPKDIKVRDLKPRKDVKGGVGHVVDFPPPCGHGIALPPPCGPGK
jgi:hypothetical protein